MKKIFTKKNLLPVIVLTLICLIVAALMASVNMITKPEIEERNAKKIKESLEIVMPDGEFGSEADPLPKDAPETVKQIFTEKNGKGKVVVLETTKGYTGKPIGITVAIDPDGKIIKSVITRNEESIVPSNMKPMGSYGDAYTGASADEVLDVVTGATVSFSEGAIKDALFDAFVALGYAEPNKEFDTTGEPTLTKEEALALAEKPSGKEYEAVEKDKDLPNTVINLFREKGGKGYAFHIATKRNEHSPLEAEGVVTADKKGVITGVEMVSWNVWYDNKVTDKPAPMTKEILNSYIGKNKSNITMVDYATYATESSDAFMNSVKGALEVMYPQKTYTVIGIVVLCVALALTVGAAVYFKKRRKN